MKIVNRPSIPFATRVDPIYKSSPQHNSLTRISREREREREVGERERERERETETETEAERGRRQI